LAYDYQPLATLRPSDFVDYVRRRKVAAPESVRVRVMTIHQAKGLEFDIVVLPQLDEKLIGQPATVAIGRQDIVGPIDAVCLHRDKQFRKLLPRRLQQMFDDDTAQQIAEALCRLYVSVTRPKYALHMIVAPSKANEKNLPKTPAGLLRAALVSDGPFGELATHYALGDANWYEHEREGLPQEDDIEKPAAEPPARVVRLAKSPAARRRPWTSPSQLEGGSLRRPAAAFALERRTATRRGTVLHAMFEQVKWLDDDSADDTELYRVALRFGVTESESSELVAEFRHLLAVEPIARVLSRASYQSHHQSPVELEVRCEQRIAARSDQHLLSGAIDRLVLIRRDGELVAADVIDFKTDALLPDDGAALAGRVAYYRPQIDAYRHAVATMFRLGPERVAGRLVFTSLETVVEM
jgi:ATP-dependent exoDNAse (exonuclease V) beta subunit